MRRPLQATLLVVLQAVALVGFSAESAYGFFIAGLYYANPSEIFAVFAGAAALGALILGSRASYPLVGLYLLGLLAGSVYYLDTLVFGVLLGMLLLCRPCRLYYRIGRQPAVDPVPVEPRKPPMSARRMVVTTLVTAAVAGVMVPAVNHLDRVFFIRYSKAELNGIVSYIATAYGDEVESMDASEYKPYGSVWVKLRNGREGSVSMATDGISDRLVMDPLEESYAQALRENAPGAPILFLTPTRSPGVYAVRIPYTHTPGKDAQQWYGASNVDVGPPSAQWAEQLYPAVSDMLEDGHEVIFFHSISLFSYDYSLPPSRLVWLLPGAPTRRDDTRRNGLAELCYPAPCTETEFVERYLEYGYAIAAETAPGGEAGK